MPFSPKPLPLPELPSPLLECVMNVSEGRRDWVLAELAAAWTAQPGVRLLHQDTGRSAGRTVFTAAGPPDALVEAAFRVCQLAAQHLDMRQQQGAHPRLGAVDVAPFVPLRGLTLSDAVHCAHQLGRRLGEAGLPGYYYEAAARQPQRRLLADVRRGEYEGLEQRLLASDQAPDFGPSAFQAHWGASIVGARPILLAWNLNLNTRQSPLAKALAERLRERGWRTRDQQGRKIQVPGRFPSLRAIGWKIPEFGRAQVSMNLTDYARTPLLAVFRAAEELGRSLGVRITGSELIGLAPADALLQAGRQVLAEQAAARQHLAGAPSPTAHSVADITPESSLHIAIQTLGLAELRPFRPEEKILEYAWNSGKTLVEISESS